MTESSAVPRQPYQDVDLFKYGPITNDQTRLLNIHPRTPGGNIAVSISTVSIDELGSPSQQYEALSYHWGIGKHEDPIYIQDSSDSSQGEVKAIYVTSNLYTALQHLRVGGSNVPMWVDAICIDQDNVEEKTAQVAKMCEIYRKAKSVCIWLGGGNESSDKSSYDAMKFIKKIMGSKTDAIFKDELYIFRWQDLARLMTSKWFSRRWVIQEVALAREATVHYGQEQVHWDDFRDTISLFTIHFDTIQGLFERSKKFSRNPIKELDTLSAKVLADFTTNIFRKDRIFEPALGLEYLVSTLYTFECSNPRDTIFALQNIARETPGLVPAKGYHKPPEPDYKKSLPEVYGDFVGWVFQTSKSLDIICRHWALSEPQGGQNNDPTLCEKRDPPGRDPHERTHGESATSTPPKRVASTPPKREDITTTKRNLPKRNPPKRNPPKRTPPKEDKDYPPSYETLPSWIPVIGGGTYGRQNKGGKNRASFVGPPGRPSYNASYKKDPEFKFESSRQRIHTWRRSWLNCVPLIRWFQELAIACGRYGPHSPPGSWPDDDLPAESGPNDTRSPHHNLDLSLCVKGLTIGQITWTSEPIRDGVIRQPCLEKAGWAKSKEAQVNSAPDKLWRTLVADRGPDGGLPPRWYHRACLYCLINDTEDGHVNTYELLKTARTKIVKEYLKRVQAVIWNRKFLEAEKEGLFGLCSHKVQLNDIVCILFGCSVPVVLRKKDDKDGGGYLFIEEAYIYGKMDGEIITALANEELTKRTMEFRLR